jgi:hypothetical protein
MKTLAIIASNPGFGGSANLNEAFHLRSSQYKPVLITAQDAPYGFGNDAQGERCNVSGRGYYSQIKQIMEDPETCFFIVDLSGLTIFAWYLAAIHHKPMQHPYTLVMGKHEAETQFMLDDLRKRKIIFFWTGSQYLLNHEKVNEWAQEIGVKRTYAMPDLMRCDAGALPLLQPYEFRNEIKKYERFTVCHSPGKKDDAPEVLGDSWNEKGTEEIRRVFEELKPLGIDSFILGGWHTVPYRNAIQVKAQSHLFIDKLSNHSAGVGKSGLEAMALGVPVLCSMQHTTSTKRYADMPVIDVRTEADLKRVILELNGNRYLLEYSTAYTLEWAQKINYRNTVEYLEGTMEWQE